MTKSHQYQDPAVLPNRLWKYRKRLGFSQRKVATLLGHLTSNHVSDYEAGRRRPSLTTALKLEILYRVPVAFLFPEEYRRLRDVLRAREERMRFQDKVDERQTPEPA